MKRMPWGRECGVYSLDWRFDVVQESENGLQCAAQWRLWFIMGIEIESDANYAIRFVLNDETVRLFNQWIPDRLQQFLVIGKAEIWL